MFFLSELERNSFPLTVVIIIFIFSLPWIYGYFKSYLSSKINNRPHSGKYCYGKTPMQTWEDSKKLVLEKNNQIAYIKNMTDTLDLNDNCKL